MKANMKILTKEQIKNKENFILEEIMKGKIFIYPTDTIYGIGCNASDRNAVNKIREIKQRESKPFSIMAPNKNWIRDNCIINNSVDKWIKKLPGPYTLILKINNRDSIANNVTYAYTIGVRIPFNWFSELISKANIPFVTTSVNISGQPHIKSVKDLNAEIENKVDYIIDDGPLDNPPSTIVDLTTEKEIIIKR